MITKVFKKEDWISALNGLKNDFKLFAPVKEGDFCNFRLLDDANQANFDFQNTRLSPKSVIFPQSERMPTFLKRQERISLPRPSSESGLATLLHLHW